MRKRISQSAAAALLCLGLHFSLVPAYAAVTTLDVSAWPCGIVPYTFASSMSSSDRINFNAALGEWASNTNLQFVLVPDGSPSPYQTYIVVNKISGRERDVIGGYSTNIGRSNSAGPQNITIFSGDFNTYRHEIGHALGLYHEHSRSVGVAVNTQYMAGYNQYTRQFTLPGPEWPLTSYDPYSVMHYVADVLLDPSLTSRDGANSMVCGDAQKFQTSCVLTLEPTGIDVGLKQRLAQTVIGLVTSVSPADQEGIGILYRLGNQGVIEIDAASSPGAGGSVQFLSSGQDLRLSDGNKKGGCFVTGRTVNVLAVPDSNSVFSGWTGVDSQTGLSGAVAVSADTQKVLVAQFDPIPPPPDSSGNWSWDRTANGGRGAWVWTGAGIPPLNGGQRPSTGCWHWDPSVGRGAWVYDLCGGSGRTPISTLPVEIITSGDPNDKVGNPGIGPARFLSGMPPLNYAIYFDNVPTATAPAQKVVVIDQLNSSLVDLDTLSLGPISFVDRFVLPPSIPLSSLGTYTSDIDLRPSKALIVRISATLNQATGVLSWTYLSLDPATMLPASDPLAGFLPPATEGSVSFSVIPRATVTGTQIANKATIVFDVNPAIDTPVWLNTIDNAKPTSQVSPLASTQVAPNFHVNWAGNDVGAGIRDFTVYASDNGAPFTPWQVNVTGLSAMFSGVSGHTYGFYSIARDLVGNVENSKTTPEATTRIVADTTPPVIVPQISGPLGNNGWYRGSVTVNWTVGDPESGIISSTNCGSVTFKTDTAGVALTCSATNGAGLSASASVTIRIDSTPPTISGMPIGCMLWPPDHKLIQVATVSATDALSGIVPGSFKVTGASNEPIDPNDPAIVITANGSGGFVVQVQADRLGTGTGRVYTLTASASDLAGNATTVRASCSVPHDEQK